MSLNFKSSIHFLCLILWVSTLDLAISVEAGFSKAIPKQNEQKPSKEYPVAAPWHDETDATCLCCHPAVRRGDVINNENEFQMMSTNLLKPLEFSIIEFLRFFGYSFEPERMKFSRWFCKSKTLKAPVIWQKMLDDIVHQAQQDPNQPQPSNSDERITGNGDTTTQKLRRLLPQVRKTGVAGSVRKRKTIPYRKNNFAFADEECAVKNHLFEDEWDFMYEAMALPKKNRRVMCFAYCFALITELIGVNGNPRKGKINSFLLLAAATPTAFYPDEFKSLNSDEFDLGFFTANALSILWDCINGGTKVATEDKGNKCAYSWYFAVCVTKHSLFPGIQKDSAIVRYKLTGFVSVGFEETCRKLEEEEKEKAKKEGEKAKEKEKKKTVQLFAANEEQ